MKDLKSKHADLMKAITEASNAPLVTPLVESEVPQDNGNEPASQTEIAPVSIESTPSTLSRNLKLIALPDGFNTQVEINRYAKSENPVLDPEIVAFVREKFDAKKFREITSLSRALETGVIDYRTAKKRDLGSDHLKVRVIGKYVVATFLPSNSNNTTSKFYEVN